MEQYYLNFKDNTIIGASRARLINDEIECREVTKEQYEEYQSQQEELQLKIIHINELKSWFENYFDKQLNQSLWQNDFVPSYDNYFNKNYNNLEELKTQAEFVRQEIKRIKYTKTTD